MKKINEPVTCVKIIKSKRGVAIESAVMLLLVVFSLCALMTTLCVAARTVDRGRFDKLKQEAEVDEIGEAFVNSSNKNSFSLDEKYKDNYKLELYDSGKSLTIFDLDGKHLLTVKCEVDIVVCWSRISVKDDKTNDN